MVKIYGLKLTILAKYLIELAGIDVKLRLKRYGYVSLLYDIIDPLFKYRNLMIELLEQKTTLEFALWFGDYSSSDPIQTLIAEYIPHASLTSYCFYLGNHI